MVTYRIWKVYCFCRSCLTTSLADNSLVVIVHRYLQHLSPTSAAHICISDKRVEADRRLTALKRFLVLEDRPSLLCCSRTENSHCMLGEHRSSPQTASLAKPHPSAQEGLVASLYQVLFLLHGIVQSNQIAERLIKTQLWNTDVHSTYTA